MPTGAGTFLGRTQLRPPAQPVTAADGVLRLQLDTYNPTASVPGDSFWGSEIVSTQTFSRGSGLTFLARVRLVAPLPGGLVASLFWYATASGTHDEIDFELLTNDLGLDRVLTNVFDDDTFDLPGLPSFASRPGLVLTDFNEFQVNWLPDRVVWKINGQIVREQLTHVPDAAMTIRLNLWAPAAGFTAAYNAALMPTANAESNQTFFYEVDYVEVQAW